MIPQELIDRLKKCCEWLGENRKDKFKYVYGILLMKDDSLLDLCLDNPIRPDPLCEYPNALHRIVKEACNGKLRTYYYYEDGTVRVAVVNSERVVIGETTFYQFSLHAEIEATCIAIEGLMEVKDDTRKEI